MTIRFFILQAHYRSTVDFSNDALQAAEKGLERLMDAVHALDKIQPSTTTSVQLADLSEKCYEAMDDDLNTPVVIAHLFDAARSINSLADGKATITAEDLAALKATFHTFCFDILGLQEDHASNAGREEAFAGAVNLLLAERQEAKANKDWAKSDRIRNELAALGFEIKDGKNGAEWKLNK